MDQVESSDSSPFGDERSSLEGGESSVWSRLAGPPSDALNLPTVAPRRGPDSVATNQPGDGAESFGAGRRVDQYRLVRPIGTGGMGVVWEAVEERTGRYVALKLLNRQMTGDSSYVQRFVREAKLAAQISHPKVTFVYGAGEHEGQPYIAMELMPGQTLADVIDQERPLPIASAVDHVLSIIDGLIAAHRLGVVHRDVKPSNCFVDSDGSVKIGDFGLSKSLQQADPNLTQSGTFMGTPSYSAPEQVRGESLDVRTDIYAVGATLYCLLTGRPPFTGDAMSVTAQIVSDSPPAPRSLRREIPGDLEQIILRCLEKEPEARYDSLDQLKVALTPFASHGTTLSHFGRRLAAFMIDVILVKLVALLVAIVTGAMVAFQYEISDLDFQVVVFPRILVGLGVFDWLLLVGYFAIGDGRWGQTWGKWLMELKVVNRQGERPGVGPGALRAFLLPGCLGLTLAWTLTHSNSALSALDSADWLLSFVQQLIVYLIPTAILLAPMREANQFRGLHEWISRTRVVRLAPHHHRIADIPVVQPQANTMRPRHFGPYVTHEILGRSGTIEVYLGHDVQLDRSVWIVVQPGDAMPSASRIRLARPVRPRWLAGGFADDHRWDAFEAVRGTPLPILTGSRSRLGWGLYRAMLKDLSEELRAAIDDQTLPKQLSLAQIWLDEQGRARLIDYPIVNLVVGDQALELGDSKTARDDAYRAVDLLRDLAGVLLQTRSIPRSDRAFLEELQSRLRDRETLDWAIDQLDQMSERMAELEWDTRIGVLGVALGIEGILFGLFSLAIFTLFLFWVPVSATWSFLAALLVSLSFPAVLGFWLRGPVFRFMDIDICTRRGALASRLTTAVRNTIAWAPFILACGALVALSGLAIAEMKGFEPPPGTFTDQMWQHPRLMFGVVVSFAVACLLMLAGAIFAIRNPNRGLPDLITRTMLLPR